MTPLARVVQVLFAAAAVAAAVAFASVVRDGEARRDPETLLRMLRPDYSGRDRLAPDFELADRHGQRVRLSQFRGRTVVLHFWTRTCGPCVEEFARGLSTFDEIVRDRRDVVLLLVTVDQNWRAIEPIVPPGFAARILYDPTREVVGGRYGTSRFPETWVIDPRGVIRARFDRPIDWAQALWVDFVASIR